jgi:hypothetical protein
MFETADGKSEEWQVGGPAIKSDGGERLEQCRRSNSERSLITGIGYQFADGSENRSA